MDARGTPLGVVLSGANAHDSTKLAITLNAIPSVRSGHRGRPRRGPGTLHADWDCAVSVDVRHPKLVRGGGDIAVDEVGSRAHLSIPPGRDRPTAPVAGSDEAGLAHHSGDPNHMI